MSLVPWLPQLSVDREPVIVDESAHLKFMYLWEKVRSLAVLFSNLCEISFGCSLPMDICGVSKVCLWSRVGLQKNNLSGDRHCGAITQYGWTANQLKHLDEQCLILVLPVQWTVSGIYPRNFLFQYFRQCHLNPAPVISIPEGKGRYLGLTVIMLQRSV